MPIAIALLAASAPAAVAESPPSAFFFQCQGSSPLQNTTDPAVPRTWTAKPPARSFTAGGGCGFADPSVSGTTPDNALYDAVVGGRYDERVRSVAVTLHQLVANGSGAALGTYDFRVHLLLDGVAVTPATGLDVAAKPVPGASGAVQAVSFGITFRNELLEKIKGREWKLGIKARYLDGPSAWVLGATEAPSGIEFNPAKLPAVKLTI